MISWLFQFRPPARSWEPEVAARVMQIDWFSQCGRPVVARFPVPVRQVNSWADAQRANCSELWADVRLEFRNRLAEFLQQDAPDAFREWNAVTDQAKRDVLLPLEKQKWLPVLRSHSLDPKIRDGLQWNVLAALMESAYRDIEGRPQFFLDLLRLYESGHFPCGWQGSADSLEGELLVY